MTKYKCKDMVIEIDDVVIGYVEGMSIELMYEGGIEYVYGSQTGKKAIGTKHATFTIRRWFYADIDKDLLFDLFNGETYFTLEGILLDANGNQIANSAIKLTNAFGLRWRPVLGTAGDTVAEELIGEAEDWDDTKPTD